MVTNMKNLFDPNLKVEHGALNYEFYEAIWLITSQCVLKADFPS